MKKTILILLCALLTGTAWAKQPEFKETDLQRVYERYDDPMLDMSKPLYRCGELVRLIANPERMAIVFDYRFDGRRWQYKISGAHFNQP